VTFKYLDQKEGTGGLSEATINNYQAIEQQTGEQQARDLAQIRNDCSRG